ncbi:MAG: hypothetical protein ACLGP3_05625 [Acidobacteriota bacterium]
MVTTPKDTMAVGGAATALAVVFKWAFTWPIQPPDGEVCTALSTLAVVGAHYMREWRATQAQEAPRA